MCLLEEQHPCIACSNLMLFHILCCENMSAVTQLRGPLLEVARARHPKLEDIER
jgi:hypothetical protein